jgi:hypothetical protein
LKIHINRLISISPFLICVCTIGAIIIHLMLPFSSYLFIIYSCLLGGLCFLMTVIYWRVNSVILLTSIIIGLIYCLRTIDNYFYESKFGILPFAYSFLVVCVCFFTLVYLFRNKLKNGRLSKNK